MGLHFFPAPPNDEKETREKTREFLDRVVRPTAKEDDQKARFRREHFDAAAKFGLTSIVVPRKYGGGELPARCFYAAMEEIAKASPAMTVTCGVTNMIQSALVQFGSKEQQDKYLPRMVSGEILAAFSLSEPHAGSDASSLRLAVKSQKGGYVLNGNKVWCSTAGHADLYLVMGRTGTDRVRGVSAFLVPKDTPGFRVGKQEKKLGLRSSSLAELVLEDCFIPDSLRLGAEGQGLIVALSQLDAGRVTIGAAGVGIAIEVIERAWDFCENQATAGGEPFLDASQETLAEHYAYVQATRNLIRQAANLKDKGDRITVIAAQCKLMGSDLAVRAAHDAIHAMGYAGGLEENEVERYLRDAKAMQIVEGTNQIQRMLLAREIRDMMRP